MRATAAFLMLAMATGGAQASSFVTPAPMTAPLGPSMILLGQPAPAAEAPAGDGLPQLAFPLGSLTVPAGTKALDGDGMLPALAFALGSLDGPPAEAGPRLAFPLGSLWAGPVVQLSPSVIAIGAPAVTGETVASVQPQRKSRRPQAAPIVVRGGEVGGAFPSGAAAAASPPPAGDATDPADVGSDAAEKAAPEAAARDEPTPPPQAPGAPEPRPTPPPAPPPGAPVLRGPE